MTLGPFSARIQNCSGNAAVGKYVREKTLVAEGEILCIFRLPFRVIRRMLADILSDRSALARLSSTIKNRASHHGPGAAPVGKLALFLSLSRTGDKRERCGQPKSQCGDGTFHWGLLLQNW